MLNEGIHSVRELFEVYGYPGNGGLSGTLSKNFLSSVLKEFKLLICVSLAGRMFHNWADLIMKLSSYFVVILDWVFGKGFITAFIDFDLLCSLNSSFILFGKILFLIFHTCVRK